MFDSILLAGILFFLGWLIDEVKGLRTDLKSSTNTQRDGE